jgi:hypothetical protein
MCGCEDVGYQYVMQNAITMRESFLGVVVVLWCFALLVGCMSSIPIVELLVCVTKQAVVYMRRPPTGVHNDCVSRLCCAGEC